MKNNRGFLPALALSIAILGGTALAQTAGTRPNGASASTLGSGAASVAPTERSGTVGSTGSAAAGDTSASSMGLGARSITPDQSSSSLSVGGSAAGPKTLSRGGVRENDRGATIGRSLDVARDPGAAQSGSFTRTRVGKKRLNSRTWSVSHEHGSRPEISRSRSSVDLGQ